MESEKLLFSADDWIRTGGEHHGWFPASTNPVRTTHSYTVKQDSVHASLSGSWWIFEFL